MFHFANHRRAAKKGENSNRILSFLVPVTGLEPVRDCSQGILSPWCLPFHHTGVEQNQFTMLFVQCQENRDFLSFRNHRRNRDAGKVDYNYSVALRVTE